MAPLRRIWKKFKSLENESKYLGWRFGSDRAKPWFRFRNRRNQGGFGFYRNQFWVSVNRNPLTETRVFIETRVFQNSLLFFTCMKMIERLASKLAAHYLTPPATSVDVERLSALLEIFSPPNVIDCAQKLPKKFCFWGKIYQLLVSSTRWNKTPHFIHSLKKLVFSGFG